MGDSPRQAPIIGMVWYRENDYDRLRTIFVDGDKLPGTFLRWKDQAEQGRKKYIRQGFVVIQAHIDPNTFPAWCAARGLNIDSSGRNEFAVAEARRILMEMKL